MHPQINCLTNSITENRFEIYKAVFDFTIEKTSMILAKLTALATLWNKTAKILVYHGSPLAAWFLLKLNGSAIRFSHAVPAVKIRLSDFFWIFSEFSEFYFSRTCEPCKLHISQSIFFPFGAWRLQSPSFSNSYEYLWKFIVSEFLQKPQTFFKWMAAWYSGWYSSDKIHPRCLFFPGSTWSTSKTRRFLLCFSIPLHVRPQHAAPTNGCWTSSYFFLHVGIWSQCANLFPNHISSAYPCIFQ